MPVCLLPPEGVQGAAMMRWTHDAGMNSSDLGTLTKDLVDK
jgi:hypothetical protein